MEKDGSLLAQAIEQNPLAILITDDAGNIIYVNQVFVSLTGYVFEEVAGKTPRMLSAGETSSEIYRELWKTIRSGQVWQGELYNRRKTGRTYWESISIAPIKDSSGRITHFIGIWNDSTERKENEERVAGNLKEFEHQSRTDELTGQYNRRYILEELEKEVERAKRYDRRLSGMMIDVDDFKMINDRYGHLIGDRVLKAFAAVISKSIRKVDILGRYGGDEFLVILPEAALETAKLVAQRIQKNLSEYEQNVLGELGKLTASIGLIAFDSASEAIRSAFIERIDQALLKSKQAGKNAVTVG